MIIRIQTIWTKGLFIFVQDMPYDAGQPCPFGLQHANMILEAVIKAAPRVFSSCYYMALVKFIRGM